MHQTRRSLVYVMLIIAIVVMPTAVALGWYQITRDPNFRPLGITREALRDYGVPGAGIDLIAYVDWPAAKAGHPARRQLGDDLTDSFASKGVEARIVFRDAGGSPQITYVVGKSVIGPYPASRAAEGIAAAVEAYRMH
jgi:hypothetical protein